MLRFCISLSLVCVVCVRVCARVGVCPCARDRDPLTVARHIASCSGAKSGPLYARQSRQVDGDRPVALRRDLKLVRGEPRLARARERVVAAVQRCDAVCCALAAHTSCLCGFMSALVTNTQTVRGRRAGDYFTTTAGSACVCVCVCLCVSVSVSVCVCVFVCEEGTLCPYVCP
jgi:hypothetical protein